MKFSERMRNQALVATDFEDDSDPLPERKMLAALLERAILDLRGIDLFLQGTQQRREAAAWIASNKAAPWSFQWVCQELDLSPSVIRGIAKKILAKHPVHRFNSRRRGPS